jgi:hypothetical protein
VSTEKTRAVVLQFIEDALPRATAVDAWTS